MRSTLAFLCLLLVAALGSTTEAPAHPSDRLVTAGTRIFDVQDARPDLDLRPDYEILILSNVDWIQEMLWSDPLTARVVLVITDLTSPTGKPGWAPDDRLRFHPDPTRPPLFHLDGYEVGWEGRNEAPERGTILIFPSDDPKRFYERCSYDRGEPETTSCSVVFHYEPDPNLIVSTRIFRMGSPLRDFAEIAARVEALVRCLDVTEALQADRPDPAAPEVQAADIIAGGRCRPEPTS